MKFVISDEVDSAKAILHLFHSHHRVFVTFVVIACSMHRVASSIMIQLKIVLGHELKALRTVLATSCHFINEHRSEKVETL